ncbi:hypothetical protein JHD50_08380 [Sulfurimonas sp. MAG313]|nr:hypothetical protein [Sulfurimonas sp. MAG313]MDF1881316.1 hypothetical protein [Sulfurimonas sp. MAG313]
MWVKEFKIAIIEENTEQISKLLQEVPAFDKVIEMTEVLYLIKEADTLMQRLQNENIQIKNKLQKHIDFVKATQEKPSSQLDTSL